MFTEYNDISVKILIVCADSPYSHKLAVGDAVFASVLMCRIVLQVIVRVGGFGVEICAHFVNR